MDYAVLETGGKQYVATVGKVITVDKLDSKEGENIKFDRILLIRNDSSVVIGNPTIDGAIVAGKVVKQYQGEKIDIMKFKAKVRYRKKMGFRAKLTDVQIEEITQKKTPAKAKKPVKK